MGNAKISALNAVTGSGLDDEDVLAIVNSTETKKIKYNELISTAALNKLSGTPIPSGKVAFASGAITDGKLDTNSVNTANVKDDNITGAKLANNSTTLIAATAPTAEFTGQRWVDSDDDTEYYWDGSAWTAIVAGTTTLTGSSGQSIPNLNVTATASGTAYALSSSIPNSTASKQFLAGPTGSSGAISARAIVGTDLPQATSSALGAVKINGVGLSINSGTGVIGLSNSVSANGTHGVVTHDAYGQITGSRSITAADTPIATSSARGCVIASTGLAVDGSGNLSIDNSATAGTYTKLTVSNKGLVTAGTTLAAGDIPDLAADQITSGSLAAARIANDSITGDKLANASTTIFQSVAQSGYPTASFTGQLLFDTIEEDCYIWTGNAWEPITTLTKGSLKQFGTYNASTSKVVSVTTAGTAAGLVVGSNLPTASANTDGGYVVVATAGTPSGISGITGALNPPDYILGVTNSSGSSWQEIDLSATVSGQIAANIGFTPYGGLSSTNLQDVVEEIETEKLSKTGGVISGALEISNSGSLLFEGSTADAFETTIGVVDPTSSDKTINFPNQSGTVLVSGGASIVSADISASAAIPLSKLANLTAAQIVVGNASNIPTGVAMSGDVTISNSGATSIASGVIVNADINASAAIAGSKITAGSTSAAGVLQITDATNSTSTTTAASPNSVKTSYDLANAAMPKGGGAFTGDITINAQGDLRFADADSSNYVAIQAGSTIGSNYTIELPTSVGSTGKVLKSTVSGSTATLTWEDDSTNVAAGSLTGTTMASNVVTSSLTTVATIASGTWAATDVAVAHGGTGSSTAAGALTNLGAAALAGATFTGDVNLGVDDTGVDLKLFGATAGAYVLWDQSDDTLKTAGGAFVDIVKDKLKIGGTAVTTTAAELNVLDGIPGTLDATELGYVDGVTSAIQTQLDTKAATGGATFTGNVNLGVDDTGVDLKLFGATAGAYLLWDESDDTLKTGGGAFIDVVKDKLKIGGTAVTTTAAELNLLDGKTAVGDALLGTAQTFTATQSGTITSVAYGASVALNLNTTNNFVIGQLTGAFSLANPSALTAGASGAIKITQHSSSPVTPTWGTSWHFAGGSDAANLTQTAGAVDVLVYTVLSSTSIACDLIKDVKD